MVALCLVAAVVAVVERSSEYKEHNSVTKKNHKKIDFFLLCL